MMKRFAAWLGVVFVFATAACSGNGEGSDAGDAGDTAGNDEPLMYDRTRLGVTMHHGGPGALETGGDASRQLADRVGNVFETAFIDVQMYDEHTWTFGEWEVFPPGNDVSGYRRPPEFRNNPDQAKFQPRVDDLVDEVETSFGEIGKGDFDRLGIVFDVWRTRRDWYVRWNGNLDREANRIGEGPYGFYESRMVNDISGQLTRVAGKHKPDYMVVGSDMERLLGRKGKSGLAPDEFSNFRQFYDDLVGKISNESPDTDVGVGINWDRFVRHVAPAFGEGEVGSVPPRSTLKRAFRSVIYPFASAGGLLALKSYRKPGEDVGYYDFLADLDEMYDMEGITFVWYSIGSPVESSASYRPQRAYLRDFSEWNRGVQPDAVVWRAMLNIDGADRGDQKIAGRCKTLVDEKRYSMPKRHCFDGLIDATFSVKPSFEYIEQRSGSGMGTGN